MKNANNTHKTDRGFVVGRSAFRFISAVEGVNLDGVIARELEEFDRRGLSARARRDAVKAMFVLKSD